MTKFSNLPKEILSMIFEQLSNRDLRASQRVCRAWYTIAHCALLKVIHIPKGRSQNRFIASIDSNLCPKYLQAVREIYIDTMRFGLYSKDDIYKLMVRFPNLRKVKLTGHGDLLEQFTEEICIDLLKACPKLNHFETNNHNRDLLYKVRLLLTVMELKFHFSDSHGPTIVQYLSDFSRLQKITSDGKYFNSFQEVLKLLQQLSHLKDLTLKIKDVQDDSVERYLANTAKDKLDVLIHRLSQITRFYVEFSLHVCVNSMLLFKYLTGLKTFMMKVTCRREDWTEQAKQVLIDILDLLCKYTGKIELYQMQLSDCQKILPIIQDRVFTSGGIFRVSIEDSIYWDKPNVVFPSIECTQQKKQLTMAIRKLKLHELTPEIPTLNNIDEVQVTLIANNTESRKQKAYMCEELLDKFPMVTKVALDITISYQGRSYNNKTYPLVEELRLHIYRESRLECNEILSRFTTMFPNLKHLDLYNFGGVWKETSNEFHVDLSNYSLQRLTMDFSPVKSKKFEKVEFNEQDFYVVELTLTTSRQTHLYKITLRSLFLFNSLSSKRINESDLQGLTDYIRVKINVDSLQKLEIYYAFDQSGVCDLNLANYMQQTEDPFGRNGGCSEDPIPHLTLFNDSNFI